MRTIVRWAVNNSPAMNTLMIVVLLAGAVAMSMLKREVFPQFELEIVLVSVPYPGASPEEVEEGICQKVEEALSSIDGVKKQTSVAQEGAGFVVVELETSTDVQKALSEVRSEIDRIPSFPEFAEDPEVEQITFREAAILVGVIGPDIDGLDSELQLRDITERVRDELIQLPSVSQANISGSRPYQIDVEVSEDELRKYGLTLQQVANLVRRQNLELPGGSMKTGNEEILLRGKNKSLIGEDIAKIPLVTQQDGVVLKISDLGQVRDAFEDVSAISRIDGKPGLVISIDRTRAEDLIKLVDEVKNYVANVEMPAGYSMKTWADNSVDVRGRMELLTRNGLQGLVLVFFMLVIFLDLRLSFWVAMGIPIAILGAGAVLYMGDKSLNMLTMFAFLMALGIVVDDAIVVGENIFAHRNRGTPGEEAAIAGTVEVVPSVTASVCTTIIAFMPLFFVSGVMGKFIAEMPLAVIAMLVLSLIESTFILPCHLAHSGEPNSITRALDRYLNLPFVTLLGITVAVAAALPTVAFVGGVSEMEFYYPVPGQILKAFRGIGGFGGLFVLGTLLVIAGIGLIYPMSQLAMFASWLSRVSNQFLSMFVDRVYLPVLRWSLNAPLIVIGLAIAFFIASLGLVVSGKTPFIVFPEVDGNRIEAVVQFPDGTPESVSDAASKQIEASIQRIRERLAADGEDMIDTVVRAVGAVRDSNPVGPVGLGSGSHIAKVEVELVESSKRSLMSSQITDMWREETGDIPGAETLTFGTPQMGPGGTPIEFKLLADKEAMDELTAASERCQEKLAEYGGVIDIRDDSRPGKWEFQIKVKEKAKALGITLGQLAETVRGSYYGEEVMRLQRGRHEVKLMVRYPQEERGSLASFEEIRVRTADGTEYPLTELADVTVKRGYSEINRIDQKRSVTVTAGIKEQEANASQIVADMQGAFVAQLNKDFPNVSVRWEGQQEQTNESVNSLFVGFAVALMSMFVLLTVEFRSYVQPLLIMFIIPFGVIGAIWGHYIMSLPITMFTLFGLVALTGVVVNDSIVLIDFINLRVREGIEISQALIDAGRRRFRPVMLTSVTTIAGLMPLLSERSFQAQFLIPLAATLVFGLLVATGLVLILIPTLYWLPVWVLRGLSERHTPTRKQHSLATAGSTS
ncbi:MAG: efflux RND transporter permease subunit [Planctomycetota bacterium]